MVFPVPAGPTTNKSLFDGLFKVSTYNCWLCPLGEYDWGEYDWDEYDCVEYDCGEYE
jgi:hypothetical protein